jgi:hypothetical protein
VTITPGTFLDSVYAELDLVSIVPADPSGFAGVRSLVVIAAKSAYSNFTVRRGVEQFGSSSGS